MAHELHIVNGKASTAYVGKKPWHGLGQELKEGAPIEEWRIAAGLDWELERTPVMMLNADGQPIKMSGASGERDILLRSDTREPLSVVSPSYQIVQPAEVLDFYKELIAGGDMQLHTAGVLFQGKKIWALAKTSDEFNIMRSDRLGGYLLFATSCDGSLATTVQYTSVRVVCNNTLRLANAGSNTGNAVKVSHNAKFNAAYVKSQLGLDDSWKKFKQDVQLLAETKVTEKESMRLLLKAMNKGQDIALEDAPKGIVNKAKKILTAANDSPGANYKSANGTAWGLLNGATYYVDHARNARSTSHRLDGAWFGNGAKLKSRINDTLLEYAKAA